MGQLAGGLPCVLDQVAASVYESPSPSPSASPETTPKHASSRSSSSANSGNGNPTSTVSASGASSSSLPGDWGDPQEGPGCEYFEAAIHSQGLGMTLTKELLTASSSTNSSAPSPSPDASVARVVRVASDGDAAKAGVVPGDVVCGVTPSSSSSNGGGSADGGGVGRGFVHPNNFDALMAALARCGPHARPLQLVVRRPVKVVSSQGHAPSPSSEKAQQRLYSLLGNHAGLGKGPVLGAASASTAGNGDNHEAGGASASSPLSPPSPTVQRAPGAKPRMPPAQAPFVGGSENRDDAAVATTAAAAGIAAAATAVSLAAEVTAAASALSLVRAYYPTAASAAASTVTSAASDGAQNDTALAARTASEISENDDASSATALWAASLTVNTEQQQSSEPPLIDEDASASANNSAAMPDWLREATIDNDTTGGGDSANLAITIATGTRSAGSSPSSPSPGASQAAPPPSTVAWGHEFDVTFSGARLGFRLERDPTTGCGRVGPVVPYEAAASFGVKPGDALVAVEGAREDRYDVLLHWLGPGAPRPLTLTFRKDSDKPPPISLSVGSAEAAAARIGPHARSQQRGSPGEVSYPGYPSARPPQQQAPPPQYPGYPPQQPQYHHQQHQQQPPWAPAGAAPPMPHHYQQQQRPGAPLSPQQPLPLASRVGELPAPGSGQRGRAAHMRSPLEDAAIELGGILSASVNSLLKDTGGPAPPYRPRAPPHQQNSSQQQQQQHAHSRGPHYQHNGPMPPNGGAAAAPPPPPWAPSAPAPMPGAPPLISPATGFGAQYTFPAELVPSNGGLMSTKVDLGALTEADEVDISFVAGPLGMRLDERGGLLPVSVVTKIEPNGQVKVAEKERSKATILGLEP